MTPNDILLAPSSRTPDIVVAPRFKLLSYDLNVEIGQMTSPCLPKGLRRATSCLPRGGVVLSSS